MRKLKVNLCVGLALLLAPVWAVSAQTAPEATILQMLQHAELLVADEPHARIPAC